MTARPPQRDEAGWFTTPAQVNHRRYEALRAFFIDRLTYQQAADRFGYTRWAMINLVREWRTGKLELFTPPRKPGPPPGVAPAKERVRGRVLQLRRQGLSTYEISARLAAEHTPLNRTSVAEILTEEGFGRLLRGPQPDQSSSPATAGRDTRLPRAQVIDFDAWPHRLESTRAGLLLVLPDLVALDLPGLVRRAGYPSTRVIPPPAGCCRCWRSSSPAPGGSPTSMTCWPIPPPGCWPGLGSCPRSPRSPATPTGCPTTTSAPSWPPWTRT